jgi:hypothetical protein
MGMTVYAPGPEERLFKKRARSSGIQDKDMKMLGYDAI